MHLNIIHLISGMELLMSVNLVCIYSIFVMIISKLISISYTAMCKYKFTYIVYICWSLSSTMLKKQKKNLLIIYHTLTYIFLITQVYHSTGSLAYCLKPIGEYGTKTSIYDCNNGAHINLLHTFCFTTYEHDELVWFNIWFVHGVIHIWSMVVEIYV